MMNDGMGTMMWGMGLLWLLVAVILVLGVAALLRYLFSDRGKLTMLHRVRPRSGSRRSASRCGAPSTRWRDCCPGAGIWRQIDSPMLLGSRNASPSQAKPLRLSDIHRYAFARDGRALAS
jgi:hypothetical protein